MYVKLKCIYRCNVILITCYLINLQDFKVFDVIIYGLIILNIRYRHKSGDQKFP